MEYRLVAEFGAGESRSLYFTVISAGFFLDDTTLIVADQRELRLTRIALATGRFEHLGRPGDGPGEFRNISGAGLAGPGSIWVTDRSTGRATVLSADEIGQTTAVTVRDYFFAPPLAPEGPVARLAGGFFLMAPSRPEARALFPDTLVEFPLLRVDATGSVIDTLLIPPPAALEGLLLSRPDQGFTMTWKLMREPPVISVDPTGSRVGFLHRTAETDSGTIGVLYVLDIHEAAVLVDTILIPGRSIAGNREELVRRARTLDIGGWPGGTEAFAEAVAQKLNVPRWISPIASYRIDSEASHWIGVESEYRGDKRWLRLSASRQAWQPVKFDRPVVVVLDARDSLVAGVLIDSLNVQTVGLFRRR